MPSHLVGSVWSVLGLEDALVVIIAGPFAADRGSPEFLVAPLYTGREPAFVWTAEDVRLEASETGLEEPRFAAIWNARPILEADLALQVGTLTEEATIAVRDSYWASLNERPLGVNPRLGRVVKSVKDPAAQFQARELEKWEPFSGRVFSMPSEASASASARYSIGDVWTLTLDDVAGLSKAMEDTESLLGPIRLDAVGKNKAVFTTTVSAWSGIGADQDLFSPIHPIQTYVVNWGSFAGCGMTLDAKGREELEEVPAGSELSKAA
jgi:hypothetical protein